jgi:hypothetical protein
MDDLINDRGDFRYNVWLMCAIALWRTLRGRSAVRG